MLAEPLQPLAVPVDELRSLEGNPRRGDVAAVARSLKRFGQRKPIVARVDGTVVAGNHTLLAARELGWAEIAVVRVDDDEVTAKAYALADNRTSALGSFDLGDLAAMVGEVHAVDPELLAAASFDEDDLNELLAGRTVPAALNDPDDVPEPPAEPVSALGDLWLLGPHRVACGDSTSVTDVERLLDQPPQLVFTDPPYNVAFNGRSGNFDVIANDDLSADGFRDFLSATVATLHAVASSAPWYVCTNWRMFPLLAGLLPQVDACIVWVKNVFGMGNGYRHQHEWIAYIGPPIASNSESDVWEIARDSGGDYRHPTQKPVAVAQRAIVNSSAKGDVVLDLFGGSGSTLIAAHSSGRQARLMELDPRYVDVICRRYQEHTGTKPILEATGEPHDFTT